MDGAHTHGHGGGNWDGLLAVLGLAAVIAAVAPVVIALINALVIIVLALAGLAVAGGIALAVYRIRRGPSVAPWQNGSARTAQERPGGNYMGGSIPGASQGRRIAPGASPQAIENHRHVHIHVTSAEEAADLARRMRDGHQRGQTP